MSDATLIVGGMLCPQTGVTQYHADKGREIKGLVVCNSCDISAFGPAKRFGYTLL